MHVELRLKSRVATRDCRLLIASLVTFVFLTLQNICLSAESHLPWWFWTPPNNKDATCQVGYADEYEYPESSYNAAFNDAALRLWNDRKCRIRVDSGILSLHGETMSLNGSYDISADTTGFAVFMESLVRIDSCWVNNLVLMLVSTTPFMIDSHSIAPPMPPEHYHSKPGFSYGIGYAPAYYYTTSSWKDAETRARLELALCAASNVRVHARILNEWYGRYSIRKADVLAINIQVIARYLDTSTQRHVVVVATKRENIRWLLEEEKPLN